MITTEFISNIVTADKIDHTFQKMGYLLLLDSHSSHSFNLHFMRFMRGHGVEVLCFPPIALIRCNHLMMSPLKKNYQQEILDYNFRHSGRKISKVDFFRVLVPAYTRSMTPKNIQSGYEHTGIYPVNPLAPKLLRTWPSLIYERCKCNQDKQATYDVASLLAVVQRVG